VFDAVSGALIVNRSNAIRLTQGSESFTDSIGVDGSYFFGGVDPGSVTITVNTPGYQVLTQRLTLVQGSNTFDLRLQPAP